MLPLILLFRIRRSLRLGIKLVNVLVALVKVYRCADEILIRAFTLSSLRFARGVSVPLRRSHIIAEFALLVDVTGPVVHRVSHSGIMGLTRVSKRDQV